MRYLTLSKTGIWQFRFQIPKSHRALFGGRREIKRSLRTQSYQVAKIAALELQLKILKLIQREPQPKELPSQSTLPFLAPITKPRKTNPVEPAPLEVLERYIRYKSDLVSEKTLNGQRAKCMIVLDLLNKKTIRQIRRIDAENIRQELKLFPINSKKHIEFQGLNNRQIVSSNRTVNRECLSESSIKDYVQKASSFFEWCNQNEYTDINPFKGIRFRKTAKDNSAKQHYTYDQLTKIFTHEGFTKKAFKYDYQFWLPFLGYYTGARLNELCQLYRDDVIQIDDLWCLHIRSTREDQRLKNINSERIIPLHSKLIEMGFVEFATKSDTRRVFDELSLKRDGYGTVASKWFGRFKKSLRFTKGHDFHSFRHTFATQLKHSSINVHTAADLLGHTCSNISYERYGKSQKISLLKAAIEEIEPILLKK